MSRRLRLILRRSGAAVPPSASPDAPDPLLTTLVNVLRDPIERLQVIYAVPLVATGLVRRLQQVGRAVHRLIVVGITPQLKNLP